MEHELVRALDILDRDERVKAIVVTGKGKMFCAGADLPSALERGEGPTDRRYGGGRVALAIHRCRKPTIAAIQGPAIGIGITMTLPMTPRIAHTNAKIGFVFSQRGVVMEAASSAYAPSIRSAFRPLFHELLPSPEMVLPRALQLAEKITRQTSTVSTYLMKEMMYRGPGSAERAHLLDSELMWELYGMEDKREGITAFLEKRTPVMKGDLSNSMPKNVPWWNEVDVIPKHKKFGASKL